MKLVRALDFAATLLQSSSYGSVPLPLLPEASGRWPLTFKVLQTVLDWWVRGEVLY